MCIFGFDSLCAWVTRIIKKYVAYIKVTINITTNSNFMCTESRVVQTKATKKKKVEEEEEAQTLSYIHTSVITRISHILCL